MKEFWDVLWFFLDWKTFLFAMGFTVFIFVFIQLFIVLPAQRRYNKMRKSGGADE